MKNIPLEIFDLVKCLKKRDGNKRLDLKGTNFAKYNIDLTGSNILNCNSKGVKITTKQRSQLTFDYEALRDIKIEEPTLNDALEWAEKEHSGWTYKYSSMSKRSSFQCIFRILIIILKHMITKKV